MVDHRLHLRGLRAFEAAASHMNFTHAAKELGVSQSAVSHQIQLLENSIKTPLFYRKKRKLELTEAGHVLLLEVKQGFSHFSKGLNALEALKKAGVVQVNVRPRFAMKWLMPRIHNFSKLYPNIKLKFRQTIEVTNFTSPETDISIEWGFSKPNDHKSHLLLPGRLSPVCAPSLLVDTNRLENPADIENHIIFNERDGQTWDRWFAIAGCPDLRPRDSFYVDDGNICVQAAINGQGITLASINLLTEELTSGKLVQPFDITIETGGFYLIYPAETLNRSRCRLFIEWLLQEAQLEETT